jgi:hypothetical protein
MLLPVCWSGSYTLNPLFSEILLMVLRRYGYPMPWNGTFEDASSSCLSDGDQHMRELGRLSQPSYHSFHDR